ncbi:MAG: LamG-like jellyroll fold domain-containing protein [Candidatus Aenigmatarchaeota archaeon]
MKRIIFFFLLLFSILIFNQIVKAKISNSSEIRGMYFHRICSVSSGYDWNTMAAVIKDYKFNLCFIPVGIGIFNASWWNYHKSCLAEAITACHSNGMEAHILFGTLGSWGFDELKDLKAIDYRGVPSYWFDPCKNITREVIKNLTSEIAKDLDIDGFNFDYIRYAESTTNDNGEYVPSGGISFSEECKAKFAQWLADQGKEPIGLEWPGPFAPGGSRHNEFLEWRVIPVTELVRDIREWMLAYKSNLEFSASVYTYWYGLPPDGLRYEIGQDTPDWVAKGYIDFVSPMIYVVDLDRFKWNLNEVNKYYTSGPEGMIPLAPFICKDYDCTGSTPTPEILRDEINHSRYYSDGFVIWRYGGPGTGNNQELTDVRPYLNKINESNPNGWFSTFSLQNIRIENITDTSVTIKWDTNLPTTSKIEYNTSPLFVAIKKHGTKIDYWDIDYIPGKIVFDSSNVTNHSITLTNLQKGIIYYYRVQSQDNFSLVSSKVYNFTVGSPTYFINLTGTINDFDTGLPISEATIECNSYTVKTNSTGGYFIKMFSTAAPTSCNLTITRQDYKGKTITLNFTENKTYLINLQLEKIKYKIYGRLRNKNNEPIEAIVIAYNLGTNIVNATNKTDSNGNYILTLLPGIYDVQFNLTNSHISYIKIPSVDIKNSEAYDLIKSISIYPSNISVVIDIPRPKAILEPKKIEIYFKNFPKKIYQNGTEMKKASSQEELLNGTWFYSEPKLYVLATPWAVPVCNNKICEIGEDEPNNPYYCPEDCLLGLMGYWKFDEGYGSIATDSSGFGRNGTLYNNPTWSTNCISGKCLSFDGIDDYVKIEKFGDFSKGFSIEFWFNMKVKNTVQRPFLSNYFATCYIDPSSTSFPCFLGNGAGWSNSIWISGWSYNTWTHFAMTYNKSTGKWSIYRNGILVGNGSYNGRMVMTNDFFIGTGWNNYFNGSIDEVAIFNRELTTEEVVQHYLYGVH